MIDFEKKLGACFEKIELIEYKVFQISENQEYHDSKFAIVELINDKYGTKFDHENWLHYKESDEVSYFLNEAGNNAVHNNGFPLQFHVWMGKNGFVIGISQDKDFDAVEVNKNKVFQTEGRGFEFYRRCKNVVFFDNAKNARCVYFEYLF
jgi:hypothetical protein